MKKKSWMSIVFSVVLMMSLVLNSIGAFAATRDVPLVSLITWNLSDQQAFRQSMPYVGTSAVRVLPDFEGTVTQLTASPRIIIGTDTRVRVHNAYQTNPYSRIGRVVITYDTPEGIQSYSATGWLFGKNVIMTAAHAVYRHEFESFPTSVKFEPARNGDEISYPDVNITDVIVPQIYIDQKERNLPRVRHDYAILIADQDIGLQYGYFGARYQMGSLVDNGGLVTGYPGDLSQNGVELYRAMGMIVADNGQILDHTVDTANGDSGAPLYVYWDENGWVALGVHVGEAIEYSNRNCAARITTELIEVMYQYRTNNVDPGEPYVLGTQ
ncbi:hypothetical protein [Diplocloster hominis]|uniref:trypsin-like serine peptidase n=1 Tax=Diplocloster hominis TaxID=3079010 RepID=UPI0031BB4D5D